MLVRILLATAVLGSLAGVCRAQTPPIFNVMSYGAVGNGTTLDSPAINAAIAAAGAAGGGTVTFPPGNYLSLSIHLTNNVTLYLSNNATILAAATNGFDPAEPNPYSQYQDYGHSHFQNSLIWGENLANVGFAGPGTINGNGNLTSNSSPGAGQADKAITLVMCSNVSITGITITRAGHFGILAQACTNMFVANMQILNAFANQHRDAFNLIDSSDVIVSNCVIQGSDDAMVLKSTYALGRKIGGHHIHIMNCQILSTQNNATQFGSETVGDFSDVTWSNLQLTQGGKAGIGITSQDGSVIDGVTYDNITMSNCACPIFLKLDYRTTDTPNPAVGRIRNVSIHNVVAVHSVSIDPGISPRTNTCTIDGFSSTTNIPIENITFDNVNVSTIGGMPATAITNYPVQNNGQWIPNDMGLRPAYGWYLRYANNISFTNCQVHFDQNDDRPAVIADTVTNVLFNNFSADVGVNDTNYDLGFLNTFNFEATNGVATTNAPVPGATLRIFSSNATPALIVSPPYFNPGDGFYTATQSVVIASTTPGVTIRYTTDGTTPSSTNGTIYSGPVSVSTETVLHALAYTAGMVNSAVNTAIYYFPVMPTSVAAPTFSPPGGTYAAAQQVTIACATPGAAIVFTTDGTTPATNNGTLYTAPVTIGSSTALKAFAYAGSLSNSPVSSVVYTITGAAAGPVFNPPGGMYTPAQSVSIASSTLDAVIRYTTDGTIPTPSTGTPYSAPVIINSNTTLNAIAYAAGAANSPNNSAVYTIVPPPPALSFEAENLPYVTNGAVAVLQNDVNSSGGHWLALEATGINQSIQYTLTNIPPGTYCFQMSYKGNTQRGILSLALDGVTLGGNLDQYSSVQTYPTQDWGIVTFAGSGNHNVLLNCVGENAAATGYWLSVDRFVLTRANPPVIGAFLLTGANLALRGVGGVPGANGCVLASTNVSLPLNQWIPIATNTFDSEGGFNFSNPAGPNGGQGFYLLKLQ